MMKPAYALASLWMLALLVSCETLGPAKAEPKKTIQLSEGELQEKYIARRNEGRRLLESRQYGKSLDAFLDANDIRANSAEIFLGIGQAYMGLEYWDKAKLFFDRYLAVEKDRNAATYRVIARLYGEQLEYFELAARIWTKAIDASVQAPQASDFYNRGLMLVRIGKKDEPVGDFRTTVDLARQAKDDRLVAQATAAMAALAGTK